MARPGQVEPEDDFRSLIGHQYFDDEPPAPAEAPPDGTVEIGAVAQALGISVSRVRDLIRKGVLPEAPYRSDSEALADHRLLGGRRGPAGRRRWPRELVTQLRNLAREEGLLNTPRRQISTTNFSQRAFELHERWQREHPAGDQP